RPHATDVVGDDAENEAANGPSQQADRGDQAADLEELGQWRAAAEQFGEGLAQDQRVEGEIGDVERPTGPGYEQDEPLIAGDVAHPSPLRVGRADFRHLMFPPKVRGVYRRLRSVAMVHHFRE